jgi:hypothetical protein
LDSHVLDGEEPDSGFKGTSLVVIASVLHSAGTSH